MKKISFLVLFITFLFFTSAETVNAAYVRRPLDHVPTGWIKQINNQNQMIGYRNIVENDKPFFWDKGIVTDIPVPPEDEEFWMTKLNNVGQVLGHTYYKNYIWYNGVFTEINTPPDIGCYANDMNDLGDIVGSCSYPYPLLTNAILWKNEQIINLGKPEGSIISVATKISNNGQIAGFIQLANNSLQNFLWENGSMTLLPLPSGERDCYVRDMNDNAQMLFGCSVTTAYFWENGQFTEIPPVPGDERVEVMSLNNAGEVLGISYSYSANTRNWFIWKNGVMTTVDLGASQYGPTGFTSAIDINDLGWLVGFDTDSDNEEQSVPLLWNQEHPLKIESIAGPTIPQLVNRTISVNATYSGMLSATDTATWEWDDNTTSAGVINEQQKTVTGSHIYTMPGVYTPKLTISNASQSAEKEYQYVVVYDPYGGFLTSGGMFASPAGAYPAVPSATGKVILGIRVQYQNGSTTPVGQTKISFVAGNNNFTLESISYDWLIINGAKARLHGIGTIDNTGFYTFLISAIDGNPDKLRIRITNPNANNAVIYDNEITVLESADPTFSLTNGSVRIHP